ncbi:MAG TPA: hypothetical protein VL358_01905 [Caulobacteraceae bacterium]|jgi:hypothetical protein|nr:hypothetical protein [Caulobacteraceae bacterium]
MSSLRTFRATSYAPDHFEPEAMVDPQAQRRLRGQLEQIDYTAFAANRAVISQTLRDASAQKFQHLAVAVATARARWVSTALVLSEQNERSAADITRLAQLRSEYEELREAYEALRRLVERGHLPYQAEAGHGVDRT